MWSFILCSLLALSAGQDVEEEVTVTPGPMPVLEPGPVVFIAQGTVVGLVAEDGDYYEYYGIPYADSTSGTHRFKAPSAAPSFQDTFVANRKGIKCIRALGVGYEGTEDCLVADVFTPIPNESSNYPVMVWIKGKEFDQNNEPELSYKHFVEKGVIVVSLNYRESILGYLCLGTETAPGNAGLKDIIAGLRWVQENIALFGGDPDNVTLFGHGSGAAAVDLVTLSPMSNGLIHRAIAQSGTAIAPWAVTRDNLEYAILVAEALGHTVTNLDELSDVFTRTSVAALMAVINELDLTDNSLAFAPCIEKEGLQNVEPFLLKSPYQTIVDGDFAQIPFMTGYVDVEGTIRAAEADNWLERMDSSFEDFLQPDLNFDNDEEKIQVANEIKTYYFGDEMVAIDDYLSYHGDVLIVISAIREARLRAAVSNSSVYLYQFSYKGDLGRTIFDPLVEVEKPAHSEELAYLFYEEVDQSVTELDLAVSDILIERWTNFAKTGTPSSESSQVIWESFAESYSYLRILDDDEVLEGTLEVDLNNPYSDVVNFWNGIYEDYFLDAEGRWELSDRNDEEEDLVVDGNDEDDDDNTEDQGESENVEETDEDENENETNEDEDENETDEGDNETDSATTAVGCTFLIISLFGILNQFHCTQLLS